MAKCSFIGTSPASIRITDSRNLLSPRSIAIMSGTNPPERPAGSGLPEGKPGPGCPDNPSYQRLLQPAGKHICVASRPAMNRRRPAAHPMAAARGRWNSDLRINHAKAALISITPSPAAHTGSSACPVLKSHYRKSQSADSAHHPRWVGTLHRPV